MKKKSEKKGLEAFEKAITAKDAGRFKLAKGLFLKASGLLEKKGRTLSWHLAAYCDKELGNLSSALKLLRKAETCTPGDSSVKRSIGLVLLEMGKPKLAQHALQKAIRIKPTAIGYIFLGSSFRRQGHFDREKSCYQSAIRLEPGNEEAHYNLGVCYEYDKKYGKAETHFHRAIEIDPKYARAYAELGNILIKKRAYKESCRVLRRSVRLNPDYYWARLYLAVAYWTLRRLKEAEEQYREALRIAPNDSMACACLGDFLSSEQRGDGESYLKRAVGLDKTNESALYFLGKHFYRVYRDKEAIFYLRKAARRGHKDAKVLLDELESMQAGS